MNMEHAQQLAEEYVDWLGDMWYTNDVIEDEYNSVIFTLIDHDEENRNES